MDEYRARRREHLKELQKIFGEAYPESCQRSHTCAQALEAFSDLKGESVTLAGRIRAIREHGKVSFLDIEDGTGRVQTYWRKGEVSPNEGVALLDLGDFVEVEGALFETRTKEKTLQVRRYKILAKALRPLPEKWHGLSDVDVRFRKRYLDLLANAEVRSIFQKRSRIVQAVRSVLQEAGFLEVETPILQGIPGGALALPFATHHEALDMPLYLRVAPELYLKRLLVGGLERVFEIGRNFRNEGLSRWHNPEFTMVEFYQAYAGLSEMQALCQEIIQRAAASIGQEALEYQGEVIPLEFQEMSFQESLETFGKLDGSVMEDFGLAKRAAEQQGIPGSEGAAHGELLAALFDACVEEKLRKPTFIKDFPADISPLAKRKNALVAHRFELFIAGREMANAFSEQNDPLLQKALLEEQSRTTRKPVDLDFVEALEYGMPPAGGCGIGLDRLVMLLTDASSIREVLLFPHLRPRDLS